MAVTNNVFGRAVDNMFKGDIDLVNDSIRVLLLSAYTYSVDHADLAAVKAAGTEASGTGYTADGQVIAHTGDKVTYAAGVITFGANADDNEWVSSTIDAAFAIVYKYVDDEGSAAGTSPVLCVVDFDGTESSVDGTFKIEWHENGIFRATVNP